VNNWELKTIGSRKIPLPIREQREEVAASVAEACSAAVRAKKMNGRNIRSLIKIKKV
jgi:hypothetical protein